LKGPDNLRAFFIEFRFRQQRMIYRQNERDKI